MNNGEEINYGLGQSLGTYKGLSYAGHGGADAGFRSTVRWYPEHDFGVVVLSNLASFNPAGIANQVTDIFLSDYFEKTDAGEGKEASKVIELSLEAVVKFRGRYTITQPGLNIKVDTSAARLNVLMEWNAIPKIAFDN